MSVFAVFDANILIADFRLESNSFAALVAYGARAGVAVGIPEVAIREATRKLRRELESGSKRLDKLAGELASLPSETTLPRVDVDRAVESYEGRVRGLANLPYWEILPLPDAQHADVLSRIHSEAAPASGDGRGYQDILIWETLLAVLDRDADVALVSFDNDFSGPDGKLDGQLASEAEARCPGASVSLIKGLRELVDTS